MNDKLDSRPIICEISYVAVVQVHEVKAEDIEGTLLGHAR